MAGIDVREFRGANTARDAKLLDPSEATYAEAVQFNRSGAIRSYDNPWQNVHNFGNIAEPVSIFRYDTGAGIQWLRSALDVEWALGPVADDVRRRLYMTGDGAPKMTHKDIAPTFRPLGVPAPAAAPAVASTIPEQAFSGAITALTCTNLMMIHEVLNREGRSRGYGQTDVVSPVAVSLTTFPVGTRMKVVSVVDANNVTVTGVGSTNYVCPVDKLNYGLRWTNDFWLHGTRKKRKAYWNFLIPSGSTLTIATHQLQPGDILEVTATQSPLAWEFSTLSTSPNTDQSARTATAAGSIVFSGNCNFIIDRGGATIDPLVPSQNYVIEQRAYVITHVTNIGEESAPSPASDIIPVAVGEAVTINSFPAVPGGYDITHRRIYRTNTGDDGTEYQFVAELAVATTSHSDTLDPSELGEVIPSEAWLEPPADLRGIIALPNGAMAGFSGKSLCFSEPGYPHAWPAEYRYPVDYDIVGIQVFGNSVFVGTKGNPYVFVGSHPRQMGPRRIPVAEPCLGRTSPTSVGDKVAYVSPNGIIAVSEDSVVNITKEFYPEHKWRELVLDTSESAGFNIRGYWYDNTLEFTWAWTGTRGEAFISLALNGDRTDIQAQGRSEFRGHLDPATRTLHRAHVNLNSDALVQQLLTAVTQDTIFVHTTTGDGSNIGAYWDGTAAASWKSKRFVLPKPTNLAWVRVDVDYASYAIPANRRWYETYALIKIRSYTNESQRNELVRFLVNFAEPDRSALLFRLPEGFIADSVEFELTVGEYLRVNRVQIGETVEDVL
jgi:hypothetical protein